MNPAAENITKDIHLSAISQFVLEDHEYLDGLPLDGRVNRSAWLADQPGGLCAHACQGVRYVDRDAKLAPFSPVGALDFGLVQDALDHVRLLAGGLVSVPAKKTNRSRVSITPDGRRQVVRLMRDIRFHDDIDAVAYRRLLSQVGRSRAALIGNVPLELTAALVEFGRLLGTYMAVAPGEPQFTWLGELCPHALFVNADEACRITGESSADSRLVFQALVRKAAADHLIVMTSGPGPVYAAHKPTGRVWELPPAAPPAAAMADKPVFPVGCGDVLAGVTAHLLGQPRQLLEGDLVRETVAFAQAVATYHYQRDDATLAALRRRYQRLLPRIQAGLPAPPAATKVA